ncbi:MAG: hypothetical protein VR72_20255 [Clostridiaceae bacterium BRH_c20a]|nr:MAG: hypothetical protein VR72_20255 [Clostridiaceae bacterium BRH_c20a]
MTIAIGQKNDYFLSSHSGRGIITYAKDGLRSINRQILLKGATDQVRSRIIRNLGIALVDRGYDVEVIHGIFNPDNLEGIIIPQLSLALVSAEKHFETKANVRVVNIDETRDYEKYLVYKSKIDDLLEQMNVNHELALEELQQLHLVFENKCKEGSGLEEGQALYTVEKILKTLCTLDDGRINHRFGQCLTSRGLIDYYPQLLKKCNLKHYLSGISQSNGSGILELVAREAVLKGLIVDVYHNCLDPNLVEMLILPEMNFAIGIRPFTDEFQKLGFSKSIEKVTAPTFNLKDLDFGDVYKWLKEVDRLSDQSCIFYHETLDFLGITRIEKDLLAEILT